MSSAPFASLKNRLIVVLAGGPGRERETSLRSGSEVSRILREGGASVAEMDVVDATGKLLDEEAITHRLHNAEVLFKADLGAN